jgi:predicted transcriptional regulator
MKVLSLKLDDDIFTETEELTIQLDVPRNRYINEAVKLYNMMNRKKMLKKQLHKESALVAASSMQILKELERLEDEEKI